MSTIWTLDGIEKKHDIYRGKDCVKKFFESFRQHSTKVIHFEKKKVIPLTKQEDESYVNQINCHIFKKSSSITTLMMKFVVKLKTIVIIQVNT